MKINKDLIRDFPVSDKTYLNDMTIYGNCFMRYNYKNILKKLKENKYEKID